MPDIILSPAGLAEALGVSTRQIERHTRAGMPYLPVGSRAKRYDLTACKAWLVENLQCHTSQSKAEATTFRSVLTGSAYIDACRKVQLRAMPKP